MRKVNSEKGYSSATSMLIQIVYSDQLAELSKSLSTSPLDFTLPSLAKADG